MLSNIHYDKYDVIYIFLLGGLSGTVYELLLNLILHGVIEDRSGSILTPFNYVYGIGAVILLIVLGRFNKSISVVLLGSFLGGAVEYIINVIQEVFLHSRSWNYSDKFLNINGRTTIPYMLFWGIICYMAICFVFPNYLKLIHKMPDKVRCKIAVLLLILIIFDAIITVTSVIRYSQRKDGIFYDSSIIRTIDVIFDDHYMKLHFPNLILNSK